MKNYFWHRTDFHRSWEIKKLTKYCGWAGYGMLLSCFEVMAKYDFTDVPYYVLIKELDLNEDEQEHFYNVIRTAEELCLIKDIGDHTYVVHEDNIYISIPEE